MKYVISMTKESNDVPVVFVAAVLLARFLRDLRLRTAGAGGFFATFAAALQLESRPDSVAEAEGG